MPDSPAFKKLSEGEKEYTLHDYIRLLLLLYLIYDVEKS